MCICLVLQEEMDSNPMVSSLLNKLANYTNLTQGAQEHEEADDDEGPKKKAVKVQQGYLFQAVFVFVWEQLGTLQLHINCCSLKPAELSLHNRTDVALLFVFFCLKILLIARTLEHLIFLSATLCIFPYLIQGLSRIQQNNVCKLSEHQS